MPNFKSSLTPIILAEGASSLVSLGAVLLVSRFEKPLEPARDFVAKHVVMPFMGHKKSAEPLKPDDPVFKKACDKASMLIKGVTMVGTGIIAHIPIEIALRGNAGHSSGLHKVAMGKATGVGVALGALYFINRLTPIIPAMEKAVAKVVIRCLPKEAGEKIAEHISKLAITDITSSAISGSTNFAMDIGAAAGITALLKRGGLGVFAGR